MQNTQTFESWMEEYFIVNNPELRKEDFEDAYNTFRDRLTINKVYDMAELYGLQCFLRGIDTVQKLIEEQVNK